MERGEIQVVTSALTLTEVLVHPYMRGDSDLAQRYSRILLRTRNLTTLPVTSQIATDAARIRAAYRLKTPDTIQLATAIFGHATAFFSNDEKLSPIPGLDILLLDQLVSIGRGPGT